MLYLRTVISILVVHRSIWNPISMAGRVSERLSIPFTGSSCLNDCLLCSPLRTSGLFFCMAVLKTTTMAEELHRYSTAPEDDALAAGAQITGFMRTIAVMDKSTFAELAAHPADVCVTIYLTTHGSGIAVNEQNDKKALKDALREARGSMEELKIEGVIDDILRPAEQLLNDDDFWQHQTHGLALFLAPDIHSCCLLPYDPGSVVHVHTSFILMPLVPMLMEGESYFLLVLSKHAAQLYQGYKFEMTRIDIPEMPLGMEDAEFFQEVNRILKAQILGRANLP